MKTESANQGLGKWLGAAALGAVAMYLFDPDRGRRRRALVRNQVESVTAKASDAIDVAGRDLGNRLTGMQAQITGVLRREKTPDDQVLTARVRAKLGRVVSHPHAITVAAQHGHVVLKGPILAHERQQLLDAVRTVHGVASVDDELEIHDKPDGIASLQGSGKRLFIRSGFMQESWTPALRCVAVAGGAVLGGYGLAHRTPAGFAVAIAGLALIARGASNMALKRLLGIGSGAQGIHLEKSIDINVPLDTVFDVWTQYENFPYFMSHVVEVRDLNDPNQLRSHWVVKGPAGTRLEWDAVLTKYRRPTLLSWTTEPGAAVEHSGSVYFEPTDSGTRVTVHLSYRPPGGMLGHGLAVLLGSDPKREMDDDLMRMKAFIETGVPPRDAAQSITAAGLPPGDPSDRLLH